MRYKQLFFAVLFLIFLNPTYALTVTLTNLTSEILDLFIMPNHVTFGPLAAKQTVQLSAEMNAQLANQVGDVSVVSRFGTLSCGQVFFFNGSTTISIQAIETHYINCVVISV